MTLSFLNVLSRLPPAAGLTGLQRIPGYNVISTGRPFYASFIFWEVWQRVWGTWKLLTGFERGMRDLLGTMREWQSGVTDGDTDVFFKLGRPRLHLQKRLLTGRRVCGVLRRSVWKLNKCVPCSCLQSHGTEPSSSFNWLTGLPGFLYDANQGHNVSPEYHENVSQ